jgi:hypothetical protein
MTVEDAVRAFEASNLKVEYYTAHDETNFTVRGDPHPPGKYPYTLYFWECWLSKRDSECIVEPPPHQANDQPLGFVVANLAEAVSLTLYMYDHRLLRERTLPLEESKEFTQRLFEKWRECQR